MKKDLMVLGVDPGTAICGFGVVARSGNCLKAIDYGAALTTPAMEMHQRLKVIYEKLQQIIALHKPDIVAVESLFFNKNVKTALTVGQARGVVLLTAANSERYVAEYTPLQVKQAVVGYGNADKQQVAYMVMRLLGIKVQPKPDDVTDALAVAICAIHSWRAENYIGR